MEDADGRYGYRAWDRRPGDSVDPTPALGPEQVVIEAGSVAPMPPSAGIMPRFAGYRPMPPTIVDVLNVAPSGGLLMNDTPTRQDSGQPGTLRPGSTQAF